MKHLYLIFYRLVIWGLFGLLWSSGCLVKSKCYFWGFKNSDCYLPPVHCQNVRQRDLLRWSRTLSLRVTHFGSLRIDQRQDCGRQVGWTGCQHWTLMFQSPNWLQPQKSRLNCFVGKSCPWVSSFLLATPLRTIVCTSNFETMDCKTTKL